MTEITQQKIEINYLQISELVEYYQMDVSASEAHGLITASVCTAPQDSSETEWIKLLSPFDNISSSNLSHLCDALKVIFNLTKNALNNEMFVFSPILPDEDANNEFRLNELAAWCRGFMFGYKHLVTNQDRLSEHAKEVINDFAEIAFAQLDDVDDDEQTNNDLFELEEYLRIGVQTIFEDLNERPVLH